MAAGTTLLQGCPVCRTRASGGHSRAFKLQRHAASLASYSGLHPSRHAELKQKAALTCCRLVQLYSNGRPSMIHNRVLQRPTLRMHCRTSRRGVSKPVVNAIAIDVPTVEKPNVCPRGAQWQIHKFGGTCVASADRIKEAAQLICNDMADQKVVVVSAMGSHPTSLVKVTDVLLNMVAKASRQDEGFLLDLAAIQEKHVETAKLLLVEGQALNSFVSRLLDDIANLKAMLRAISIGMPLPEHVMSVHCKGFSPTHAQLYALHAMTVPTACTMDALP